MIPASTAIVCKGRTAVCSLQLLQPFFGTRQSKILPDAFRRSAAVDKAAHVLSLAESCFESVFNAHKTPIQTQQQKSKKGIQQRQSDLLQAPVTSSNSFVARFVAISEALLFPRSNLSPLCSSRLG
jgi:hypothetical protein